MIFFLKDSFANLIWKILKKKIEPEQWCWQIKYWGDWIYDDKNLICDKI